MNNTTSPTLSSKAYVTVARHQDCPSHKHINCEFVFFVKGVIKNKVNELSVTAPAGSLFFINDNVTHSLEKTEKLYEHRDLYIPSARLKEICHEYFDDDFFNYLMQTDKIIQIHIPMEVFAFFEKRLSQNQSLYLLHPNLHRVIKKSNLNIAVSLLEILYEQYLQQSLATRNWLTDFLDKIQSPQIFTLPISKIIRLSNYSTSYFSHQFSQTYNIPFKTYITKLKIDYAKILLGSPNPSLSDIAMICGFSSQSHFTQIFKSVTGITPLQYRKSRLEKTEN